jgi:TIR domain
MQKSLVFISHITEEKAIAQALKELIEKPFLHMIEVFMSSDPNSLKLGRKWLQEITDALKACAIEIILVSPESVKRPWINFEGGCGWIRDIPVIPLCHSGTVPSKLPPPLSYLQSATATEQTELMQVFPVLADAIKCQLPQIDYSVFIDVVKKYEEETCQIKVMESATPVATTGGLSPHELAALVEIGDQTITPGETISATLIRSELEKAGYRGIAVSLALTALSRKNLIEIVKEHDFNGHEQGEYPVVSITEEGWPWLETNQDKLWLGK